MYRDDVYIVSPLDLNNVSVVVSGFAEELENEHIEAAKANNPPIFGTKNEGVAADPLERSRDVLCIPGRQNDGDIDLVFKFGAFGSMSFFNAGDSDGLPQLIEPAPAIVKGNEKSVRLMVSPGSFMDSDKIGSAEFKVDNKSPKLITSGDDKPQQVGIQMIRLTFDEPLDSNTVENAVNWKLVEGAGPIELTVGTATLDASSMTNVTLVVEGLLKDDTDYQIQVQAGPPTVAPGDKAFNPIIYAAGANKQIHTFIGTITTNVHN